MSRARALVIGISLASGGGVGPWNATTVAEAADKEVIEAKQRYDHDLDTLLYDTQDDETAVVARIRGYITQQQNQHGPYQYFGIGFGVRGNRDMTLLFEKLMNLALEVIPGPPKLVFPTLPNDINASVERVRLL